MDAVQSQSAICKSIIEEDILGRYVSWECTLRGLQYEVSKTLPIFTTLNIYPEKKFDIF
jgi:hypothetical protein